MRFSARARTLFVLAVTAGWLVTAAPIGAQLPGEPLKDAGQSVYPAFEGWYENADGSYSLLLGYFNRNLKQELDIPIGADNQIMPGGPDLGQPTHFMPRRGWGVLVVRVPKDFGDRKITWTLGANGTRVSIAFGLTKGYQIEPLRDAGIGNTPPTLSFGPDGPSVQGPPPALDAAPVIQAAVGQPVPITVHATDDAVRQTQVRFSAEPRPPARLTVSLSPYRAPGRVVIAEPAPRVVNGQATTSATFDAPGNYVLRAEGNDDSGVGGSGFQCCWTTAYVRVTVR